MCATNFIIETLIFTFKQHREDVKNAKKNINAYK